MASKIGPGLESHPKIRHAWSLHRSSLGLHLLALSFAQRTGGFVSTAFVMEKIPAKRERTQALAALTAVAPEEDSAMWSEVEGGWRIHNFAKHTEFQTPEAREQISAKRSEAGRKGAAKKWQNAGKTDGNLPEGLPGLAISDKERELPKGYENRLDVLSLCDRLASAMTAHDPKAKVAPRGTRWLDAMRLLIDRDGRTVEEIERVIDWCQADSFWRPNIESPTKLREKFTTLVARMGTSSASDSDAARRARTAARQAIYEGGVA